MFYPNHHCRSYCRYLGSLTYNDHKLDMGVYESTDGSVSHAIVFGPEPSEYFSGDINFTDPARNFQGTQYKINKILYENWLHGGLL